VVGQAGERARAGPSAYVERGLPTIAQLADEHCRRKVRKGLRPNSLADMKRKLEIHLLPHFGHTTVTELTSRDVEAYLDRKLSENRRIEAALAIGEPLVDGRGRAMQSLRPQTITRTCTCSRRSSRAPCARDCSHATPPTEGPPARGAPREEVRARARRGECARRARHGRRSRPSSTSPNRPPSTTPTAPAQRPVPRYRRSSRPPRSRVCASASCARSTASTSTSRVASFACLTPRRRRGCAASTSTTISRTSSARTRRRAVAHGSRVSRRL
jgi:hypothetical protein